MMHGRYPPPLTAAAAMTAASIVFTVLDTANTTLPLQPYGIDYPPPRPKRLRLGSGMRGAGHVAPADPVKKAKRKAQKRARAITRKSR